MVIQPPSIGWGAYIDKYANPKIFKVGVAALEQHFACATCERTWSISMLKSLLSRDDFARELARSFEEHAWCEVDVNQWVALGKLVTG